MTPQQFLYRPKLDTIGVCPRFRFPMFLCFMPAFRRTANRFTLLCPTKMQSFFLQDINRNGFNAQKARLQQRDERHDSSLDRRVGRVGLLQIR